MSDDIRSSTCCPSTLPDGNAGIWSYVIDQNDAHPAPEVTCPDDFVAWLQDGEYIIPNFHGAITIDGLCGIDAEFLIEQDPLAGTVIAAVGDVEIEITVTDNHGNEVTCGFTIDVRE